MLPARPLGLGPTAVDQGMAETEEMAAPMEKEAMAVMVGKMCHHARTVASRGREFFLKRKPVPVAEEEEGAEAQLELWETEGMEPTE